MVALYRTLNRAALVVILMVWASAASAVSLIRDADIEYALTELARPLINAAGLNPNAIRIIVVNDPKLNAFIVDGSAVFINSGLIQRLGSAAELQAVIAHELAHIANGHIVTRSIHADQMRATTGVGFLLGLVAAAAGGGEAAAGLALGVSGSAVGNYLGHTRGEEASADMSAVRYMAASGIDPRAALDVFELFRGQEVLSTSRQDAYVRTHPLTTDRLRSIKAVTAGIEKFPMDENADYWFRRAQAKLTAFLTAPSTTLRRYRASDQSDIAHMARAAAHHRKPDPAAALAEINKAIDLRPQDPFFYDLKGQILLESRAFSQAVVALERANELRPNHPQILAGLGRAHLAVGTSAANQRALHFLQESYARDPRDARMLRDLAVAYARSGENAMASLATAERYAMLGRGKDAVLHAKRAAGALPEGSTAWRRARDVIHAAELAQRERNGG